MRRDKIILIIALILTSSNGWSGSDSNNKYCNQIKTKTSSIDIKNEINQTFVNNEFSSKYVIFKEYFDSLGNLPLRESAGTLLKSFNMFKSVESRNAANRQSYKLGDYIKLKTNEYNNLKLGLNIVNPDDLLRKESFNLINCANFLRDLEKQFPEILMNDEKNKITQSWFKDGYLSELIVSYFLIEICELEAINEIEKTINTIDNYIETEQFDSAASEYFYSNGKYSINMKIDEIHNKSSKFDESVKNNIIQKRNIIIARILGKKLKCMQFYKDNVENIKITKNNNMLDVIKYVEFLNKSHFINNENNCMLLNIYNDSNRYASNFIYENINNIIANQSTNDVRKHKDYLENSSKLKNELASKMKLDQLKNLYKIINFTNDNLWLEKIKNTIERKETIINANLIIFEKQKVELDKLELTLNDISDKIYLAEKNKQKFISNLDTVALENSKRLENEIKFIITNNDKIDSMSIEYIVDKIIATNNNILKSDAEKWVNKYFIGFKL